MNPDTLRDLLNRVRAGEISVDEATRSLQIAPEVELPFAKVDTHRAVRCGFPEVIYCEGKTTDEVAQISKTILEHSETLLATRASRGDYEAVREVIAAARYHEKARCITVEPESRDNPGVGRVVIVSAGTADVPVAEEARVTAETMGSHVVTMYDAGVAGIHRLLSRTPTLLEANAIVVVAGMEGALASVVGGLVAAPVISVPTSVGYGASFRGLAPLLTMLNSCSAGVCVVNIDNGFGAGYLAALINRRTTRPDEESR